MAARRNKRRSVQNEALIGQSLLDGKMDRHEAERALRESNAFLDSVIENIPNMIFVKDAKELKFVRFNKAAEELVGYPKKLMIGKNDYDFFPRAEADFFTKKDREVLSKGVLFDIPEEPIHTRKHGVRILHTKKIPILNEAGRPAFLLGISEDITDRLNLQREIAAISDREQKRIGQDLHDGLGQHLTGVAFLIQGLSQRLAAKKVPEAGEAAKIAKLINSAIGMTRNLAHVLNPIELESGSLDVALRQLAKNTERLLGVACTSVSPIALRLPVRVAVQVYRIAQEAVDNAIKHGKSQKIQISLKKVGPGHELLVYDNGRGFKASSKRNGMGIHNMIFRAQSIGGRLEVKSRPGKGTVVKCEFSGQEVSVP
jgi:PAS domain S-box-containing protein